MAGNTDSLIREAGRIAGEESATIANLASGAQLGLGAHLTNLDAATPLTLNPIIPIVTSVPTMFENIPHAEDTLKALIERHPKSISGIDFEYQLEGSPTPVGHDGQQLNMPTNARRTQVTPQFTWQEVTGNLIWNFFKMWISMTRDANTQASSLAALDDTAELLPQLVSSFSMDVIFIQFDSTMRPENIIDAFICTGMWPQQTGMAGWQRTVGEVTMPERSISFNAVLQHTERTRQAGRAIAEVLGLHRVNFNQIAPVANQIASRLTDKGIQQEAAEVINDAAGA